MAFVITPSGARIAWDAFGSEDLPPMVLIQGHGAQLLGWREGFCERLVQEGFRVIRFDNRDVGQSQRYPEGGYELSDLADDTAALLDGLGLGSAHVVGQSMGGMVAQQLALRHPHRVRSLGLLYTAPSLRYFRGRAAVEGRTAAAAPASRDAFVAQYLAAEAVCRSTAYPQDTAWLTAVGARIWDRGWEPGGPERQLRALLTTVDHDEMLRALRVPTTILTGDSDQLVDPAASARLREVIPRSTLTVFPGMGHELPEPLWDEIAALLGAGARRGRSARTGRSGQAPR
ncbi:alpha/beta hydrolase [Streptomyces sp. SID14478]|uniref:alpha/beta fold hydrolase n=1 Tax=Streptomyces sp. SID14478 TaxID=2706073 RepID=UPI0013DD59BF|nr:alpha/beta hydrolase [Streptomyces sp. SID14478]NEB79834.1 alpha/beta hydrolase [Streptomyces sp. SID14478]